MKTLETQEISKSYRGRRVVDAVSVQLEQGEVVGLLGPNGAGKTTTFYMVVGLISPDAGRILIDGQDITRLPMYRRAQRGISYLPQEPSVFRKMTVEEKIGQVFMIWCRASFLNVENPEYQQLLDSMQKYHVGSFAMTVHVDGPFLLRSEPYEAAELLNRMQRESKLPLLVAADFERGVSMRLLGTTVFPHAMAFGADGKIDDALNTIDQALQANGEATLWRHAVAKCLQVPGERLFR